MLLIVCACGAGLGYWLGRFAGGIYSRPAAGVSAAWSQKIGGVIGLAGGYFAGLFWHLRILVRRRARGRRLIAYGTRIGAILGAASAAVLHAGLGLATAQFLPLLAGIGIGVGAVAGVFAGVVCGAVAQTCYRH